MPTKRKRTARYSQNRITPAAIAAYKSGDELALDAELRLQPWEPSPLDVDRYGEDCEWSLQDCAGWLKARELRRLLRAEI